MAQVWQCDRCEQISKNGDVDGPPENWVRRVVLMRGTEGARGNQDYVMCGECDDDLYRWLHDDSWRDE